MKFTNWVEAMGGPIAVGKLLRMTPHAVRMWTRGQGTPSVPTMLKIIKLSNNTLTCNDIIGDVLENAKLTKQERRAR